jgi:hypothetical protein
MSENQHARQLGTASGAPLSSLDGGVEAQATGNPGLVDFFLIYCPPRFPAARSRRAKQVIAKKYRLPTVRIGWATLIDPKMGDDRLRELAQRPEREESPRRGRPRLIAKG